MSRFLNVKNDNSADGEKIIWDEEINILQPEVVANLDKLRNGKEIVLPLKSVAVEDKKENQSEESEGGTNGKEESDEDAKEEGSLMNRIFSFFAQCLSKVFGRENGSTKAAVANVKDPNEVIYQNPMEFKPKVYEFENYSSDMPLLEEHQKELSPIWSTFKPKSIITGRRTMRRLSEKENGVYTLKKIKFGENDFYILHQPYSIEAEKNYHSDHKKLEQVYATLTQSTSKTPYTGYFLQSAERRNLTVYYTSEIDAHWNSQKFEIKALKDTGNHIPYYHDAYRTAIQCFYSDIKECIYAFYNDTHVTLKLFTYAQLVQIVTKHGWNINKPFNMFHTRADKIAKFIKENDHKMLNKIAKITTKNNEMVFEIQD
uniref:Uncharacterized protein n=1 Tax=Panagrolaimus davidi TaxID=227884 RepID=A0A914QBU2_9BILA